MTEIEKYFRYKDLTPAQAKVAAELMTAKTAHEIAAIIGVSHKTVKAHSTTIYRKLGVKTKPEMILAVAKDLQTDWKDIFQEVFRK